MINISHPDLNKLARIHAENVLAFLSSGTSNRIALRFINKWISSHIDPKLSLEDILIADADGIQQYSKIIKKVNSPFLSSIQYIRLVYAGFANSKRNWLKDRSGKPYNGFTLLDQLDIKICPYCNRNFISNLGDSKTRLSQLDHFHEQSKYPLLAMSFYNLIPCCRTCNFFKRGAIKPMFNPYSRINADAQLKVHVTLQSPNPYVIDADYEIVWKTKTPELIENERVLHLRELYSKHKYHFNHIIRSKYLVKGGYFKSLNNQFLYPLGKPIYDYRPLLGIHGTTKEDLQNIPLSKASRDVWTQFDKPFKTVPSTAP